MTQNPRRIAAIGLAILLIVGVGYGILSSARDALGPTPVALHGLIGSEKAAVLPGSASRRARSSAAASTSRCRTAGSRQIAAADLSKEDFAFPAGVPAAEKIRRDHAGSNAFVPFFTPMAIATWKPIVDLLTAAGVVHSARVLPRRSTSPRT